MGWKEGWEREDKDMIEDENMGVDENRIRQKKWIKKKW